MNNNSNMIQTINIIPCIISENINENNDNPIPIHIVKKMKFNLGKIYKKVFCG